ncbi:hypothetical protein NKJ09_23390 [Mesorhizobium sp. M0189]|uniref:hypothetical protein n=1 Tax=Mesorhizobium sp. M0189 TaxID=2956909 RepID=UPI00333D45D5
MKIADNVDFNLDVFRGQRAIFQAAPGGGKSTGARLLLEACYGRFQNIILDVEDEFHTLRKEGCDYAIIGGDHGDAPLGRIDAAGDLALTLLKVGVPAILQINDLDLSEKRQFVANFVRGLMTAPRDLWHPVNLMLDESHLFVPESSVEVSSEPLKHYATAGRKRGFGAIFATQRLSLFSKDILGVCANKFLGRVEQSADRRAAADQLGFTAKSPEAVAMQAFRPGDFYCVGPALSPMPVLDRLYKPATEVPAPGSTVLPSATPAAIQRALASLVKASKTPPAESGAPAPASQVSRVADPAEIAAAEKRGHAQGYAKGFEEGRDNGFSVGADYIKTAIEEFLNRPRPPKPMHLGVDLAKGPDRVAIAVATMDGGVPKVTKVTVGEPTMSPSSRKVVDAVVSAYPMGISLQTAAKRAGLSARSSAFRKYLTEAAASPRIQDRGDGRYVAVEAETGLSAPAGLSAFKERLPPAYARMLDVMESAQGAHLDLDAISERSGVSRTSSGLSAGLKELVALELIVKTHGGGYRLSPDFI